MGIVTGSRLILHVGDGDRNAALALLGSLVDVLERSEVSLAALGLRENLGDGGGQRGLAVVDGPMVPMLTCGLVRSNFSLAMKPSLLTGRPRTGLCLYTIVASQHTIESHRVTYGSGDWIRTSDNTGMNRVL